MPQQLNMESSYDFIAGAITAINIVFNLKH